MRKGTFASEQMLPVLGQAEAGRVDGDIRRKLDVTQATFYKWIGTYAGYGCRGAVRVAAAARRESAAQRGSWPTYRSIKSHCERR